MPRARSAATSAAIRARVSSVESSSTWISSLSRGQSSAASAGLYLTLALAGDLRDRFGLFLVIDALAFMLFLLALRLVLRLGSGRSALVAVLVPAGVFRLILLVFGVPSLSGDVHRYVWD